MILKNDVLQEEFFQKMKLKYPDLQKKECVDAVNTSWVFLRKTMESGTLETVRLKYFGTFQVYKGRATRMLINLKTRYDQGKVSAKQYNKLTRMLNKFIENYVE